MDIFEIKLERLNKYSGFYHPSEWNFGLSFCLASVRYMGGNSNKIILQACAVKPEKGWVKVVCEPHMYLIKNSFFGLFGKKFPRMLTFDKAIKKRNLPDTFYIKVTEDKCLLNR